MPFKWLQDFQASAKTKLAQFNNAQFKKAAMATCALIAAADGEIEAEEKKKVANLIQKNDLLQVFNAAELRDLFLEYAEQASDDFDKIDLLGYIGKLKGNEEQSIMCVRIGLVIANADGEFEDSEKKVVAEICKSLGLNAAEYTA